MVQMVEVEPGTADDDVEIGRESGQERYNFGQGGRGGRGRAGCRMVSSPVWRGTRHSILSVCPFGSLCCGQDGVQEELEPDFEVVVATAAHRHMLRESAATLDQKPEHS